MSNTTELKKALESEVTFDYYHRYTPSNFMRESILSLLLAEQNKEPDRVQVALQFSVALATMNTAGRNPENLIRHGFTLADEFIKQSKQ